MPTATTVRPPPGAGKPNRTVPWAAVRWPLGTSPALWLSTTRAGQASAHALRPASCRLPMAAQRLRFATSADG
jgi:hypothetical protein